MRRKDREIKSFDEIEEVIKKSLFCQLGVVDNAGMPYVVPLNFGYLRKAESFEFYFHSALAGHKIEALENNDNVCLSFVDAQKHEVYTRGAEDEACKYTAKYASVIVKGNAVFLTNIAEKIQALKQLMHHQVGEQTFHFREEMVQKVAVIKVIANEVVGKMHQ